jgi:hypothetical protein
MHRLIKIALAVLMFSSSLIFGQTGPGVIQPFSTLETHEYETINLDNLNIELNVPVRPKAGHIPFSFRLKGSSGVSVNTWFDAQGHIHSIFVGGTNLVGMEEHAGSSYALPFLLRYNLSSTDANHCTKYGEWDFYDIQGTVHPAYQNYLSLGTCAPNSAGSYTLDGSGLYVFVVHPFKLDTRGRV